MNFKFVDGLLNDENQVTPLDECMIVGKLTTLQLVYSIVSGGAFGIRFLVHSALAGGE